MCLPRAHPPKSCSSLDRAGHCHKVPFLSGELWSNIFSKVKSIFCPDQELGVQPKRNDKHLFLPGQPQHTRQQVKDQSKMLGFSISHFHTRSSLNFFIYCFASEGFRSSFKDLVRTRWWRGRPFKRQPSTTSEITEIWNICAPFFPELVENAWSGFPGQREDHLRTKKFLARTYSTTQAK